MGTVEGSIEALTQAILSEARSETEELTARAAAQADSIRQRAEEAAARDAAGIIEQAKQEARRLGGQTRATAQMKARALELEHRERLLQTVFDAVAEQLPGVVQRKDYDSIVKQLVREAVAQLQADTIELVVDQTARTVLSKEVLHELSVETGARLSLGNPLESGIGVLAKTADGRLLFDNTLETRLSRTQASIRSAVHKILMGEAE